MECGEARIKNSKVSSVTVGLRKIIYLWIGLGHDVMKEQENHWR